MPEAGSGEIARLGGAFNSIAQSLAARDRQLRVTNDRLQGILDHATTSISVRDVDGRYLVVNRAWEHVAGVAERDAIGRSDVELFGADLTTSMDRLLEAIASHIGQCVERARLLDELRAAAGAPR